MKTADIAFFDFDGTITSKDSLAEILKFIKGKFSYYAGILVLSPVIVAYKIGILSNHTAKEILLAYFLKDLDVKKFNALCVEFTEKKLPGILNKSALLEIRRHMQQNTQVVIISASAENWLAPWCTKYNITCIATRLQVKNGKLTGKIEGRNCSGKEKVRLIKNNYVLSDYKKIYAYGDSPDDLPMLALATEKNYKPFRKYFY
ncbi:HAD-IB family hydrolase [Parafilimonas sp.]|uniref:HAD-IB family hydrolase n=1 Tax=Parafilimonas sp. TaxID=1969739 RepID=UPI0039E527EE